MQGATTACVVPFLIDRYEVTNSQYLTFWNAQPEKQRRKLRFRRSLLPLAWADNEPFPPEEIASKPVLGVTYEGAKAYATWAGKRLPTPYEWNLAAFGPTGGNTPPDWAKQYIADRQKTWQQVEAAHLDFVSKQTILRTQYFLVWDMSDGELVLGDPLVLNGVKTDIPAPEHYARELHLPWYFYRGDHSFAVSWSKNTVMKAVAPLFDTWKRPMHVLSVGERAFNISPYGARDMALNAFELVCPPGIPGRRGLEPLYARALDDARTHGSARHIAFHRVVRGLDKTNPGG